MKQRTSRQRQQYRGGVSREFRRVLNEDIQNVDTNLTYWLHHATHWMALVCVVAMLLFVGMSFFQKRIVKKVCRSQTCFAFVDEGSEYIQTK